MDNEIEAKFSVTDELLAKQLQTVETLDALKLMRGKTTHVRDTYLDTPERQLFAAGYFCRRRKQADGLLITIKKITNSIGAIHDREELEIKLDKNVPPSKWQDSPARDRVLSIISDAPLRPLLTLQQTRVKRDVLKDDAVIGEWSVDDVCVRASNKELKFWELEIELKSQGTPADMENVVASVQLMWGLAPEPKSKFERALAWVDQIKQEPHQRRHRVSKIKLDDRMAEAARKTLLVHWQHMLDHEAGARAGTVGEEVHDMRVATRRMRAAIRVFREYLDVDTFRPYARRLRRTARTLGAVRDLDVFHEKAQEYLDELPDDKKSELDALFIAWQSEYLRARGDLIEWLDSDDYANFKTDFDEFLRRPGAGAAPTEAPNGNPTAHRVRDAVPLILLRSWAIVRAYDESVSVPDVPLGQLHQLRIASKGLRYTLEFFAGVLGSDVQALIKEVKELQDHLGKVQDGVVACNILRDFLTWGEWSHDEKKISRRSDSLVVAPGVAMYLAVRQNEINKLVQEFPKVWSPIRDSKFKKQLLALIVDW
ncbi:MAG: CHAD domain-containing protein [Chloroflexi bacterium]|nr:CHAD domain-containing protein [Chloroflexota bacterium]